MDTEKYIEYAMAINNAFHTTENLSLKTKPQLKEFATSIGLSVNLSMTKEVMLETIWTSEELNNHEKPLKEGAREDAIRAFNAKYPEGYNSI